MKKESLYGVIVESIFFSHYSSGVEEFTFERIEIEAAANRLKVALPKNIGDVTYSFRFRKPLPERIRQTESGGREWIIELYGRSNYRFRLAKQSRIEPSQHLVTVKVPDATPEIILAYAQSDEQALLAKVRYNRLIDIFLGIATYSLQNHLRTTIKGVGQIEIDEIYVGVDKFGRQFVIPIQAKVGKDQHGVVQTMQDIAWCKEKYPSLICRAVSAQFLPSEKIALFELTLEDGEVRVVDERHYHLVASGDISVDDLRGYSNRNA